MFRSSKHEVRTLEVNKLALSRNDDKHIMVNGISSLARGHWAIRVALGVLRTPIT